MLFSLWQLCYGEATKLPNAITHPDYDAMTTDWAKFRFTYEGGHAFVEEYLERFSAREDNADFVGRQKISYSPSHAKAAIIDIKNAIYQRMIDITREDGSDSYRKSVVGEIGGVDLKKVLHARIHATYTHIYTRTVSKISDLGLLIGQEILQPSCCGIIKMLLVKIMD